MEGTSNIMALELLKLFLREAKVNKGDECVLFRHLKNTLDQITLPLLSEVVFTVTKELEKILGETAYLLQTTSEVQNAHARQLLDKVVDLTCAVFLLEEAQYENKKHGTQRLLQIARYYVNRTYQPGLYDIQGQEIPAIDLFGAAVCYGEEVYGRH
mgnify:CR=1 FL=1